MKLVINPQYSSLEPFIKSLPTHFEQEGTTIFKLRNELKRYRVDGVELVVKRYKVPHFINRVAYTLFRPSKARRAYEYGLEVERRGINTPTSVAYIEERSGWLFSSSYYVSLFDTRSRMMREFVYPPVEGHEHIFDAFAAFTVDLHQKGILHRDYSPGNILFEEEADGTISFSLIDINRMRFGKLSREECLRSFMRITYHHTPLIYIARAYATLRGWNPDEAADEAVRYHDEFLAKREKRWAWKRRFKKKPTQ